MINNENMGVTILYAMNNIKSTKLLLQCGNLRKKINQHICDRFEHSPNDLLKLKQAVIKSERRKH